MYIILEEFNLMNFAEFCWILMNWLWCSGRIISLKVAFNEDQSVMHRGPWPSWARHYADRALIEDAAVGTITLQLSQLPAAFQIGYNMLINICPPGRLPDWLIAFRSSRLMVTDSLANCGARESACLEYVNRWTWTRNQFTSSPNYPWNLYAF